MAATVEEITLGRNPVTSIAPLPNRVFDIVWKMNLNTALNAVGIKSSTVGDVGERSSTTTGYPENFFHTIGSFFNYNLTTNSTSKIIKLVRIKNNITNETEKLIYGKVPDIYSTHFMYNYFANMSYDGNYIISPFKNSGPLLTNTITNTCIRLSNNNTNAYYGTLINDNGTVCVYASYSSSNYIINTVAITGQLILGSTGSFSLGSTGTVSNNTMFDMNGSNTTMVVSPFAAFFNTYGFTGTSQWALNNTYTNPGGLQILSISFISFS